MAPNPHDHLRIAAYDDGPQLVRLWALLFDEDDSQGGELWRGPAAEWFAYLSSGPTPPDFPSSTSTARSWRQQSAHWNSASRIPNALEDALARLANVITLSEYRGAGYGTLLVENLTQWARSIGADRVDLSATPEGQRIYARAGFVLTSAPRMKLVL